MDWAAIFENTLREAVGQDAIVYALAAIGLNVHFGYTGLLNFGQAAFLAVGAYGVAISVFYWGWPLWAGIGVGVAAAVVLALLLGAPTLRLRADYLAIVTIAAAEIVRLLLRSVSLREYTGGSRGINNFSDTFNDLNPLTPGEYGFGPLRFGERGTWVLLVGWALVALATLLVALLVHSPWGRVVRAIREDEDAARSLGKNVYGYKLQSLVLGGVIGAFGGMVFALGTQSVQPDNYGTPLTFFAYAALILGGTARIFGPVVGAMIFWGLLAFTDNFLRQAVENDVIPNTIMVGNQVGQVRFMLVGLGLVLLMVFRPQGLIGDRREIVLGGH